MREMSLHRVRKAVTSVLLAEVIHSFDAELALDAILECFGAITEPYATTCSFGARSNFRTFLFIFFCELLNAIDKALLWLGIKGFFAAAQAGRIDNIPNGGQLIIHRGVSLGSCIS